MKWSQTDVPKKTHKKIFIYYMFYSHTEFTCKLNAGFCRRRNNRFK